MLPTKPDPELIPVGAVAAQKLTPGTQGEVIVYHNFPADPIDPQLDHVLPAGVVHRLLFLVLRVYQRGDEFLAMFLLILGTDGDGRHQGAVTHHRLLD